MSSALSTLNPAAVSITETRASVAQMVAQRGAIVEVMKTIMKIEVDYGVIPGTPKPTLYKPGSEKIMAVFHLAASPSVEDISTPDCIRYRVTITITHAPTGQFLGQGIGEASSAESKYQWRECVCMDEWEEFPEDRTRIKWKKGYNGKPPYKVYQVRAEMEDVANTVLKMAKKRAQIDAVLTVTAASDIFAQDLEDLKAAGIDPGDPETPASPATGDELQKKAPATQTTGAKAAAPGPAAAGAPKGGAVITEGEAKRFWAVAMERTNDYKVIMDYLKNIVGVTNKAQIPAAYLGAAMEWAEKGTVAGE